MKICEYENVKCPYCGEEEHLLETQKCSISSISGPVPGHLITCKSCGGDFAITCQD